MKLSDVLDPRHVVVPLKAATVQAATEQLAGRLIAAGAIAEPGRLNAVLRNTWPEDMVSVGEHAFLPHFRTEAVRQLVAAVGVSPAPIKWERDPHRAARIVILVVAPPRETATYLQVLGTLARVLSSPETVLALLAAKTPEQVVGVPGITGAELPGQLTVADVMTTRVHSVGPDETLGSAARYMLEHDIRSLPVVDESGALVGIVTHKELLKHLIPDYLQRTKSGKFRAVTPAQLERGTADPRDLPVRDVMARAVLCLSEDQSLPDVASLMSNKDLDRFPVVRQGRVVGFLTRADLIRRLVAV
ncbi:MAG TPA: CBS domain-containing protein [Gemmatimonadales bacterium]|nr:CBS domain-containing protein [Gemmatimonadales bacterium]